MVGLNKYSVELLKFLSQMKNKFLIGILAMALAFVSCSKEGEVKREAKDFIKIHGKVYKLVKITPEDNGHPIWIMYPKDSADTQPVVINQIVPAGKTTTNQALIILE